MTSSWEQVCHPGEGILALRTLLPCLGEDSARALKRAPDRETVQSQSPQLKSPGTFAVPVTVYQLTALSPMSVLLPPICSGGPKASLQTTLDLTGDGTEEIQK